jgi:hypothetical protein
MANTKVCVFKAVGNKKAKLTSSTNALDIVPGTTSLPISVKLTNNPSKDVTVTLAAVLNKDEQLTSAATNLNNADLVVI